MAKEQEIPFGAYDDKVKFDKDPGGSPTFPFDLVIAPGCDSRLPHGANFPLFRSEAEALRDQLNLLLDPPKSYVTVKIVGHDEKEWHYEDPGFGLVKDDLVRVNWGGATKVGIVRANNATPPSWLPFDQILPILAKFTAEEL